MNNKQTVSHQHQISYRNDALSQLSKILHLPPTRIAKTFNQTNNITVNRWLEGRDLYLSALLSLCNFFRLDLLSFFTCDGHTFQTNLCDIIKMEEAGLSLRQLLEEKGIVPCTFDESRTLSALTPHDPSDIDAIDHPHHRQQPTPIGSNDPLSAMPAEYLDRFIAFQCNAHDHERQMLEQQRHDMQTIIDDKDHQIAALQKELNRLKKQKPAATPYFGMAADESELGEK